MPTTAKRSKKHTHAARSKRKPAAAKPPSPASPANGAADVPPLSDWYTKTAVVQLTGLSERTVERMATEGRIQQAFRQIPGRRPLPVYHPGDVQHVARAAVPMVALDPEDPRGKDDASNSNLPATRALAPQSVGALFQQLMGLRPPPERPPEKLWVTLAEAAELSGLPIDYVRELARTNQLPAIKRKRWFISRRGLYEFRPN